MLSLGQSDLDWDLYDHTMSLAQRLFTHHNNPSSAFDGYSSDLKKTKIIYYTV